MSELEKYSNDRVRLGVDFHVWDGIFQGSRSHILNLYRSAIRIAPDFDFVFFLAKPETLAAAHPEFRAANVRLVEMKHRAAPLRLGLQLPWLQWKHRLDLLHMQYRLPLLRTGPCACTVHDILFETHPQYFTKFFVWQSRLTSRLAANNSAIMFAVSEFSKSELVKHYGVSPEKVSVTYNGVDRAKFYSGSDGQNLVRSLGLNPGDYILTVGRLEPRKNHCSLIRAYSNLNPSSPPLVIVGQRDFNFDEVFDLIDELNISSRVKILENISDVELPAVMRHATVFAYPAFAEGFGMPVAEAMASGVPVITSNTTSLPEVAGNGALLIDPADPDELAQALRHLLESPEQRLQLTARAQAQVTRFDWQDSARVLVDAVRSNVHARRRTSVR